MGLVLTLGLWVLATAAMWRGNGRRWDLGVPDLVTVSLFALVGITMVMLALGGPPSTASLEAAP